MPRTKPYGNDPVKARIYNSYRNIRQCAYNPNNTCYQRAQAAGLDLECYWSSREQFYQYVLENLGPPPTTDSRLIRCDQNRSWRPGNIEWNTHLEQGQRYRTCTLIKYQGLELNITQWSERLGISRHTIYGRWGRGVRLPRLLLSTTRIDQ